MKTLLPNGSVVLLKGTKKRIMIYGRLQKSADGSDQQVYDYIGCPYPEGNISPEQSVLFDHEQIAMVFFIGFQDLEELELRKKMMENYEQVRKQGAQE